jgi:hypothetical protein
MAAGRNNTRAERSVHRRDSKAVAARLSGQLGRGLIVMRRTLPMLRPLLAIGVAVLIPGTQVATAQSAGESARVAAPKVSGAWVRLPAATGRPAGGYLTVTSAGPADSLVGASSPLAERIELHSMAQENGVMRMRRESALAVPAAGTLSLSPGGSHLMLFGLSADLKPGARLPIVLDFRSGAKVRVDAESRAPGAPAKAAEPAHRH